MNQSVKITEGALYCGIVFMFLMVNRRMGNSLEYLFYWFLSFPIILYGAKYGLRNNIVLCSAMMIMAMIFTSITTWFYLFSAQIVGIFYGHGVKKQASNGLLMIISIIFTLFAYLITTVLFANFFGYNINEDIAFANLIIETLQLNIHNFDQFVLQVIIFIAVLSSILQGLTLHMVSNILLKRLQIDVRPMKNPVLIATHKGYGVFMIASFIAYVIAMKVSIYPIFASILIFFEFIAFFMALYYGIMVIWYHSILRNKKIGMMLVVVFAFIPPFNLLIAIYGVYNQFVDTRLKGRWL